MARKPYRVSILRNSTEVKQANAAQGGNFFSPSTMRWFGSRLNETVYPTKFGTIIVTSERDTSAYTSRENRAWGGTRRYTVRFVACRTVFLRSYGEVYTNRRGEVSATCPDSFGRFASHSGAHAHARREQARLSALRINSKPVLFTTGERSEDAA